jgi:hypothetical protein
MLLHTNLVTQHCVVKEIGVVGVSGSASFRSVVDVMTFQEMLGRLRDLAQSRSKKRQLAPKATDRSAASTSAGDTSPSSMASLGRQAPIPQTLSISLTPARELTITADALTQILQPLGIVDETAHLTHLGSRCITRCSMSFDSHVFMASQRYNQYSIAQCTYVSVVGANHQYPHSLAPTHRKRA